MSEIIATENKINLMKKAIVTQSNRFIYARYNMTANQLKLFFWIVAKLNSQKDSFFKTSEIPIREIMQLWGRETNKEPDYVYVKEMCDEMIKAVFFEDYRIYDEETRKLRGIFQGFPIFKKIRYIEGEAFIRYEINDALVNHLLQLTSNFTSFKWKYIAPMKSQYGIRIYNMICAEIKQNRNEWRIHLRALQNILDVPKSYIKNFSDFNRFVLEPAKKDINETSDLVITDIEIIKDDKKIVELKFIFDFKDERRRAERRAKKFKSFIKQLEIYGKSFVKAKIVRYPLDKPEKELTQNDLLALEVESAEVDKDYNRVILQCKRIADNRKVLYYLATIEDYRKLKKYEKMYKKLYYTDEACLAREWQRYKIDREKECEIDANFKELKEAIKKRQAEQAQNTLFDNFYTPQDS